MSLFGFFCQADYILVTFFFQTLIWHKTYFFWSTKNQSVLSFSIKGIFHNFSSPNLINMDSIPNAIDPVDVDTDIDVVAKPSGPINWSAILEQILDSQPINVQDDQLPEELSALNCLEGEDYIRVVVPMKSRC